jgi:hypothetical protein
MNDLNTIRQLRQIELMILNVICELVDDPHYTKQDAAEELAKTLIEINNFIPQYPEEVK